MMTRKTLLRHGFAALTAVAACTAFAKLPPPTPAEAQAAAAKKADAAAKAEKDKQLLSESMDKIVARWRAHAAKGGIKSNPPTSVTAPAAAIATPSVQSSPSGQPGGKLGSAAQAAPVRSEKSGTAPPSEDVKTKPTGAAPARQQGG